MHAACAKQPNKRSFSAEYCRLLCMAGKVEEAESYCNTALEKNSSQAWAMRELCRCAVERGDYNSARLFAQQALYAQPDDWESRRFLASQQVKE
jgi:Flp pilus assembly protein TadD